MTEILKQRLREIDSYPSIYKFYVDFETSGGCPYSTDIIKGTFIVCKKASYEIEDIFQFKSKPFPGTWSQEASDQAHKISFEEAMSYPPRNEAIDEILDFLSLYADPDSNPSPFIFHALNNDIYERDEDGRPLFLRVVKNFDWAFILAMFNKENRTPDLYKYFSDTMLISTIRLARLAGYKSNNRLNQWAERIGFELNHHDDLSDAKGCKSIHEYLATMETPIGMFI